MKKSVLTLLMCFFISLMIAQEKSLFHSGNLNFRNYTTVQGLSQRSVVTIAQDQKGYLWFGTRYGLNKFDGHTFKNYYYNSDDSNSLSDSWITTLVTDKIGNLWIGTKNGLNKYDPENDNFIRVKSGLDKDEEYINGEIWDIITEDSGHLWIATSEGLWNFESASGKINKYTYKRNMPSGISSNLVLSILKSSDNILWICTDVGIDLYNPKTNIFSHYKYPNDRSPSKIKNTNVTLFEDSEKKIWLGYNDGLAVFNISEDLFQDYKMSKGSKAVADNVRSLYEDKDNNLWIGTYQGLYVLDRKNDQIWNYRHDINLSNSLSQNSIYDIIGDSRGDIWVGTWAGGINYLNRSSTTFSTYKEGAGNDNINYKVVSAIVEDKNENLWVGTEGGGINFYDKKKNSFKYYTNDPNDSNSLIDNNVKTLLKDHLGNLWTGTHNKGLNYVLLQNSLPIFKTFPFSSTSGYLSSNRITSLVEDKNHNIWIGTDNGGLNLYHTSKNIIHHIPDHQNVLGSFVYTITNYFDSSILVGGKNGLVMVDINTRKIQKIWGKEDTEKVYGNQKVISIYPKTKRDIWIGTEGDGLFHYDIKTKSYKQYKVREGLPDDVVYGIVPDGIGNLWLSTNKGLSKFNPKSEEFQNFNYSDGLQANEFNYGAHLRTSKGELIFGGVNGYTLFSPHEIKKDTFLPPLAIQSIRIRNKQRLNVIEKPSAIKLNYDQNDITFDYIALGYSQPNKNQYAYKLKGFDKDWNYVGNNRTATYTNLYPGDYEFSVKATNSDGVWAKDINVVKLHIKSPLWKTWWAFLIYFLIAAVVLFIIRKYSIERLQEKALLRKERQEREREEELNKLKLKLFTNISHDFRTPLTLIIGPLKQMIDNKIGDETTQQYLAGMYRNASILLQLINQLLDFRKSEAGKLKLSVKKMKIIPFLQNIKLSFEELAKERDIEYQFMATDPNLEIWFDEIEMKKVILNVLSNAFKFTPRGGDITMSIKLKSGVKLAAKFLELQISDTGKGIRKQDIGFIFDRYFQLGQQNEFRSGTGVGLALAKDIVELHRGKIYVESQENKGTIFTILLPFGSKHFDADEIITSVNESQEDLVLDYFDPETIKLGWINEHHQFKEVENITSVIESDLKTLLLVEDNVEVRNFIRSLFVENYNILEAANGIQGIEIAKNKTVDLIISDVMMPLMDGIEFCHKIKSDIDTSHVPVVLLTARTSIKTQKIGYNTGADVYITKPFDSDLLVLQVANLLRSRQNFIEKFKKELFLIPKKLELKSPDEIFLKKAIKIIEENISDSEFMASTLVDHMHMSQSVLYRKLKALTGQSISEFIRMVKLNKASQLLLQTDLNIANIAYEVGFNDLKYFRTCFKKTYGLTASQYRKSKGKESKIQFNKI
ncbi:hybrid sensor histidine kinase/response regulator transcription factor [Aquimarina aggregata]|uniref:hybrid sensor histidine kinase/response regulator transcription factor n=1 Tax=Aquimarina aggregata TaxID=1642818 RepID=UPI00248F6046|nr:hybrid sensor histidine kinase/response regulator transcription factor [Aquimarina aggregata]